MVTNYHQVPRTAEKSGGKPLIILGEKKLQKEKEKYEENETEKERNVEKKGKV